MKTYLPEGSLIGRKENTDALSTPEKRAEAAARGTVLEAYVPKCDAAFRLHLSLGSFRGIIPKEEGAVGVAEGVTRPIALITRVGKPVQFVITGFTTDEKGEPLAVCSRRLVQEKCTAEYLDLLSPGDALDAVVTHMEGFGAFCDVGAGVTALLPVDHISVSRISHPSDRFVPGQHIRPLLKSRDDLGRLTLTLKETLGTWEENAAAIEVGETVTGIIRSVEPYGVFVELFPNLAGLAEYDPDCVPGQTCVVYVKSVNPEKMKIKLNIISVSDEPSAPIPPKPFFTGSRMDRFVYSPPAADRIVETVFEKR